MLNSWINAGKPKIFGIGYTYYYHILVNKYRKFTHPHKASACCSMVTSEILRISFPKDNDPFLDTAMWKQLSPHPHVPLCTVSPEKIYHIGMKHGIGLSGGAKHHDKNGYDRNFIDDSSFNLLKNNIDDKCALVIAETIKKNHYIQNLDLSMNRISTEGYKLIAERYKSKYSNLL
jgi:hypothetical protein